MTFSPLCLTTMYNRPRVSEIFLEGMKRLNIPVLAVVSDADSMGVCEKYGAEYYYYDNSPLGSKRNHGVMTSLTYNYTHLILCDDDDVLSDELPPLFDQYQDHPFLGLSCTYIIKPSEKKAVLFTYTKPLAIGTCRVIQRGVIETMVKNKTVELYDPKLDKKLDWGCDMRLLEKGHRPVLLDKNTMPMCVGIKSDKNIWPFENYKGTGQSSISTAVEYDRAIELMGDRERELVEGLSRSEVK